jgi:hypothetical protein
VGDHSSQTFKPLWAIVQLWHSYFYVTDGWSVYPGFIPEGDQIISKTYLIRVEGENTLASSLPGSVTSKDALLFQIEGNAEALASIADSLSQIQRCSCPYLIHP